ncbi:uncharacterized protein LY89DRAFT_751698 [Mollisia scopiformis]|uniref:Uncharacterized protein n=1 Tax=Mollisia scopiformis TaxID=149040 RepID=A0A194X4B8_MOLSC|nr:uncharacterized protein LY89DRAFT_751698 [Mollisia scopiformis]KUJ15023.1 hypothetical protein LY89DRAFT_751698 [Mollisia scopiformis]
MPSADDGSGGWWASIRSPLQALTYILALGSTLGSSVANAAAIPSSDLVQRDANPAAAPALEQPWKRFVDIKERGPEVDAREAETGPIRVIRGEDFSSGLGG